MGFFDFVRRGKKADEKTEEKESVELFIANIPKWVDEKFSIQARDVDKRVEKICKNIINELSEIRDSVKALENASFEADNKTYAAVNMVKSLFVKRSYSLLGNRPKLPENPSYSDLESFHSETVNLLTDLKKISPKQAILISNFFKKESANVFANIKETEKHLESLQTFLKTEAKIKKTIEDAISATDEYKGMKKQFDFLENKNKELDLNLSTIQKNRSQKRTDLKKLIENRDWKNMEMLDKEIKEFDVRISDLQSKITSELSIISRPLKKLEHMAETDSDFATINKKIINQFVESPFDAMMNEHGESLLKESLKLINDLVGEKKLTLKQKDHDKILELIRKLETQIPWIKERYVKTLNDKKNKQKEMENLYPDLVKQKNDIEAALDSAKKEEERLVTEADEICKDKENIKKEMKSKKERLQNMLSEDTGFKVKLS